MTSDPPSFDDPALKSAVKRAWGNEAAPAELRNRIEQALRQDAIQANGDGGPTAAPDVIRVAPSFWRRTLMLSLAAAVLAGLGLFAIQLNKRNAPVPIASIPVADMPADLGAKLVGVHGYCRTVAVGDHHFLKSAPKGDFKAIARALESKLNHPVIAAPVGNDWDFRGGTICPVGMTRSAHLVFARGDSFVSIFSLPASAFSASSDAQRFDATLNDHPMAGFANDGALVCVVGSSGKETSLDLSQVKAIRDQLHSDASALAAISNLRLAKALP
jgi:hypothetical protein